MKICGLEYSEISILPLAPFVAFLLLLNGGYFVAFTAAGGQSIGKMIAGVKVVPAGDEGFDRSRAARSGRSQVSRLPGVRTAGGARLSPGADQRGQARRPRPAGPHSRHQGVTRLAVFIATVGYCGYFPFAPGTVGSAAGLVVYLLVWWTGSSIVEIGLIVVLFAAGVWAGTTAERYFGGVDPGPIVLDEVVGMLITLAFIPIGWSGALAGFFSSASSTSSSRTPPDGSKRCTAVSA